MEVGGRGREIINYTVTTRMTPALRWAAMRAILMFHNCEEQSQKTQCPQTTTFEEKREPKRIRTAVPLLTSLAPYREAKAAHRQSKFESFLFMPTQENV